MNSLISSQKILEFLNSELKIADAFSVGPLMKVKDYVENLVLQPGEIDEQKVEVKVGQKRQVLIPEHDFGPKLWCEILHVGHKNLKVALKINGEVITVKKNMLCQ